MYILYNLCTSQDYSKTNDFILRSPPPGPNLEDECRVEGDRPLPAELEQEHEDEDDQEGVEHRGLEELPRAELGEDLREEGREQNN